MKSLTAPEVAAEISDCTEKYMMNSRTVPEVADKPVDCAKSS